MINDGCGLCVEIAHEDKLGRSLWVKCDTLENGDVVVRHSSKYPELDTPFVVATPCDEHGWTWGHYFADFESAYEYLMKGEI